MQQDYQRFTPELEMLWDTAALLYRKEDEEIKRAGYRLALHVLAETPDVCLGLARVLLSEIACVKSRLPGHRPRSRP